jgi:Rrf2 family transcriptional regulator, cysteine metabolism repressor
MPKLMKISVKCEYAIRALLDLSLENSGSPIRIADIARRQSISQKFLELILAELKRSGFVESRRGVDGGYLLSRRPETLTVGEVIRAVEGPSQKIRMESEDGPAAELWRRVDESIASVVDKTSFADLAKDWQERKHRYVPNWEI